MGRPLDKLCTTGGSTKNYNMIQNICIVKCQGVFSGHARFASRLLINAIQPVQRARCMASSMAHLREIGMKVCSKHQAFEVFYSTDDVVSMQVP